MLKKILVYFFSLVIFTIPIMGSASVVGVWSVKGTVTESVNVSGFGTNTVEFRGRDVFKFRKDRSFIESDGIRGRWIQKRSNFLVSLNKDDIATLFYSIANDNGLHVLSFNVPSAYISGKQSSRMTGNMVIEMQGEVYAFNGNVLNLSAKANMRFSGKRSANTARLFALPQTKSQLTGAIRIIVRSFIEEAEISR